MKGVNTSFSPLSHEAIAGVVGGTVLRVLRQVELVAASMSDVSTLEDDVKPMFESSHENSAVL